VEWLESSHGEDGRDKRGDPHWEPRTVAAPSRWRVLRDARWWGVGLVAFASGGALAIMLLDPGRVLPSALAWVGKGQPVAAATPAAPAPAPVSMPASASATASAASASAAASDPLASDAGADAWAHPAGQADVPPDVKALAVTQLVVPARAPDCDTDLTAQVAPTGMPWPAESGYVDGYPLGNQGDEMQVLVDNSNNSSPVLVKIVDLDHRATVRHAYVQGHAKFLVDKLSAGKYEVRYQNIMIGETHGECVNGRRAPLRQAAARQPGA
jgi:hypothetical protein